MRTCLVRLLWKRGWNETVTEVGSDKCQHCLLYQKHNIKHLYEYFSPYFLVGFPIWVSLHHALEKWLKQMVIWLSETTHAAEIPIKMWLPFGLGYLSQSCRRKRLEIRNISLASSLSYMVRMWTWGYFDLGSSKSCYFSSVSFALVS